VRKTSALIVALGLLASLSACSTSAQGASCSTAVAPGDSSNVVTATGGFNEKPTVSFPVPLYTKKTERTVLIPGDGAVLQPGDSATVEATILNGTTGGVLQQTGYDTSDGNLVTIGPSALAALTEGLKCARVGSRIAVVASPQDSTGGQGNPNLGMAASDSLVLVMDIKRGFPAQADGVPQITPPEIPSIVLAPNGQPGIVLPPGSSAPEKLEIAVEKQGNGAVVKADDYVVLKYTGMTWDDKSVFDSTWQDGTAKIVQMKKSDTVVEGFVKGVVGQKVGSQVVIVAPPSAAFGDEGGNGVGAGQTVVYVVDILGIVSLAG